MAGAYYIWIMAAFAIGCGGVLLLLIGLFLIGHWLEKKKTGATHGFLELPKGAESRPAKYPLPDVSGQEHDPGKNTGA
jgi:hypothetical protein